MAAIHGDRLGWFAVRDGATTSDFSHAHGRDFQVSRPPASATPWLCIRAADTAR
ncbi:hypothetical protein [Actinomadura rubrisoli]|uniref:hypothetical protein n=1 Tax=Actinomadura rubrisoli TaxID=2530368 RepID=UPI0014051422|nr:hypothetical protein [Actinomadura rubrisoli]